MFIDGEILWKRRTDCFCTRNGKSGIFSYYKESTNGGMTRHLNGRRKNVRTLFDIIFIKHIRNNRGFWLIAIEAAFENHERRWTGWITANKKTPGCRTAGSYVSCGFSVRSSGKATRKASSTTCSIRKETEAPVSFRISLKSWISVTAFRFR